MFVGGVPKERVERTRKNGMLFMENRETVAEANEDMLFADGFDEAIVGYVERCGQDTIACYDSWKIIDILSKDMSREEAIEYYSFNIVGAYVGENTPCFLTKIEDLT